MALTSQPEAARRKIVDMLMPLSRFRRPEVILEFRQKTKWNATTLVDVSFVNAVIICQQFQCKLPSAIAVAIDCRRYKFGIANDIKSRIANNINSELNISASDMLLVLQTMRRNFFVGQGLVIVLNREQGLGWYRVVFVRDDSLEQSRGVPGFRLEYICSLEIPGGGANSPTDMEGIMILNFLHMAETSPEGRRLTEEKERLNSFLSTFFSPLPNSYVRDKSAFDAFYKGAYATILEIACTYTFCAGYHARCLSYVDSLVTNVDDRQMVVSTARWNRQMLTKQGRDISFSLISEELGKSVLKDAEGKKLPASCHDLYEYGRFCAQGEVTDSWYDLLLPTVENKVNVNFAQSALTGRGSYTNFVARNMSVCLKDSILLCDPASDSIAVAFAEVSELSNSLKLRISELMETTVSERLRAAFFICRGAVRARRDVSTRMIDVMRSRITGLEGIVSISAKDVVEVMDEGELRNPAVLVECMESLAMQGGYRADSSETSLFNALCSDRECEKTIVVTGMWPPVFGKFLICRDDARDMVKLQGSSELAIVSSRHADIYRARQICEVAQEIDPTSVFIPSDEVVCIQ